MPYCRFRRAAGSAFTGLAVVLMITGCSRGSATSVGPAPAATSVAAAARPTKIFPVKGVVKSLGPEPTEVRIQHEAIPDYMPAMTMPFSVKDARELEGIKAGDAVSFRLLVDDDHGWIDQVKKTSESISLPAPRPIVRRVRDVEPLNVGDLMPDYPFTNELGRAVHLADFKGRAVAFTFIFTRCPFPEFCPRLTSQFAAAYKKLKETPGSPQNWKLLSISFDPEFDTPKTLQTFAERYKYEPDFWSFLTGEMIEIDAITEQFGLVFARNEEGTGFDHKLRTVVVDATGRVQSILKGNMWSPDELVAEITKAAAVK